MTTLFNRLIQDERLYAVGLCLPGRTDAISTFTFPPEIRCAALMVSPVATERMLRTAHGLLHVAVRDVETAPSAGGRLVLVHDMSFVERRSEEIRRYLFYFFVIHGHDRRPHHRRHRAVLLARLGAGAARAAARRGDIAPHGKRRARAASDRARPARTHPRPRASVSSAGRQPAALDPGSAAGDTAWRAARSRHHRGQQSRAFHPRPHAAGNTRAEPGQRPGNRARAGDAGLLGTWIAHGSGSADRETVDANDRVDVPPDHPEYRLRRVWLSPEEETGYYSGFANEGLWPLCHNAHVRPTFRSHDFEHYRRVNERFADAVVAEARTDDPIVLVQDYHFALLPRLIRDRLPKATIIAFWHIPWPNPEAFAICPWRQELLDGLLGSSILGFHTQFHCNNFLDTVDRLLESRVDREDFAVTRRGHCTQVHRYPI